MKSNFLGVAVFGLLVLNSSVWAQQHCVTGTLELTEPSGWFVDGPEFSNYINYRDCAWAIDLSATASNNTRIWFDFEWFDVECNFDYVVFHDGLAASGSVGETPIASARLSGTYLNDLRPHQWASSGPKATLRFVTDPASEFLGFNATYVSSPCPYDCYGRGVCDQLTGVCTSCDAGWAPGSACKEAHCDTGTPCGPMGACNASTGFCDCEVGWTGATCELDVSKPGLWIHRGPTPANGAPPGARDPDPSPALPSGWPEPRARSNFVECPVGSAEYYGFGGFATRGAINDLWRYNATDGTWESLYLTGTGPTGRGDASLVCQGSEEGLILFGGSSFDRDFSQTNVASEMWTWSFENRNWTLVTPTNTAPDGNGLAQTAMMRFNSTHILVYGGEYWFATYFGSRTYSDRAYLFDEVSATWYGPLPFDGPAPEGRWSSISALITDLGPSPKLFVFGGKTRDQFVFNGLYGYANDTWVLDLGEVDAALSDDPVPLRWTRIPAHNENAEQPFVPTHIGNDDPSTHPSLSVFQRSGSAFAYAGDGKILLFGGRGRYNEDCRIQETWMYSIMDNAWLKLEPSDPGMSPLAVDGAAFAPYTDPVSGGKGLIMWGGQRGSYPLDVWTLTVPTCDSALGSAGVSGCRSIPGCGWCVGSGTCHSLSDAGSCVDGVLDGQAFPSVCEALSESCLTCGTGAAKEWCTFCGQEGGEPAPLKGEWDLPNRGGTCMPGSDASGPDYWPPLGLNVTGSDCTNSTADGWTDCVEHCLVINTNCTTCLDDPACGFWCQDESTCSFVDDPLVQNSTCLFPQQCPTNCSLFYDDCVGCAANLNPPCTPCTDGQCLDPSLPGGVCASVQTDCPIPCEERTSCGDCTALTGGNDDGECSWCADSPSTGRYGCWNSTGVSNSSEIAQCWKRSDDSGECRTDCEFRVQCDSCFLDDWCAWCGDEQINGDCVPVNETGQIDDPAVSCEEPLTWSNTVNATCPAAQCGSANGTSCGICTSLPGTDCGWCGDGDSLECIPVGGDAGLGDPSIVDDCRRWTNPDFGFCPTLCFFRTSCGSCLNTPGCGWCGEDGSSGICMEMDENQDPEEGLANCPDPERFWWPDGCPPNNVCTELTDVEWCGECVFDVTSPDYRCGFCQDTWSCGPTDENGEPTGNIAGCKTVFTGECPEAFPLDVDAPTPGVVGSSQSAVYNFGRVTARTTWIAFTVEVLNELDGGTVVLLASNEGVPSFTNRVWANRDVINVTQADPDFRDESAEGDTTFWVTVYGLSARSEYRLTMSVGETTDDYHLFQQSPWAAAVLISALVMFLGLAGAGAAVRFGKTKAFAELGRPPSSDDVRPPAQLMVTELALDAGTANYAGANATPREEPFGALTARLEIADRTERQLRRDLGLAPDDPIEEADLAAINMIVDNAWNAGETYHMQQDTDDEDETPAAPAPPAPAAPDTGSVEGSRRRSRSVGSRSSRRSRGGSAGSRSSARRRRSSSQRRRRTNS